MFKPAGHQPWDKVDWVHSSPGALLCNDDAGLSPPVGPGGTWPSQPQLSLRGASGPKFPTYPSVPAPVQLHNSSGATAPAQRSLCTSYHQLDLPTEAAKFNWTLSGGRCLQWQHYGLEVQLHGRLCKLHYLRTATKYSREVKKREEF